MHSLSKITLLTGTLILGSLPAFGQSLDEGLEAYQRGSYVTARKYLEPFAEQGNATAQIAIGAMYADGYGVPKNSQEAVSWYRLAAEQGHALGQASLALMYESGEGIPQNYPDAFAWYRLAAVQGVSIAQHKLGKMYETGRGVPQNYGEAVSWYRLAAEQGNNYAQFNLSGMYYQGQGVSRNKVMAYMLTVLAAAQGNETAHQARDLIIQQLSREQVDEGQRMATEWRVGTPLPTYSDFSTL